VPATPTSLRIVEPKGGQPVSPRTPAPRVAQGTVSSRRD
jgi:hypothetical protein